jgi:hypothetical protein
MKKVFYNRYECEMEDGRLWIYDRKSREGYSYEGAEGSSEFAHDVGGVEKATNLLVKIADSFGYHEPI